MKYAWTIAAVTAAFLLAAPKVGAARPSHANVPLFARFASDGTRLRSYVVPVHANITVHKVISIRARLAGNMRYAKPDRLLLTLNRVSPEQRRVFARIATPRAWPQFYNLHLLRTVSINGRKHYMIRGTPQNPSDPVDHLVADVPDGATPVLYAQWFLRGKGTITMHIQTATVNGYVLPVRNQTDINVPGYRVHADVNYGHYDLRDTRVSLR